MTLEFLQTIQKNIDCQSLVFIIMIWLFDHLSNYHALIHSVHSDIYLCLLSLYNKNNDNLLLSAFFCGYAVDFSQHAFRHNNAQLVYYIFEYAMNGDKCECLLIFDDGFWIIWIFECNLICSHHFQNEKEKQSIKFECSRTHRVRAVER